MFVNEHCEFSCVPAYDRLSAMDFDQMEVKDRVKQTYMKNFSTIDAVMQVVAEAKTSTWKEGDELKWPSWKREVGCEEKRVFSKYSWPRL